MEVQFSIERRIGFVILRLSVLVFHLGNVERRSCKDFKKGWDFEEIE